MSWNEIGCCDDGTLEFNKGSCIEIALTYRDAGVIRDLTDDTYDLYDVSNVVLEQGVFIIEEPLSGIVVYHLDEEIADTLPKGEYWINVRQTDLGQHVETSGNVIFQVV